MDQLIILLKKSGTPTMGGVLILIGIFSGILLWGRSKLMSIYLVFNIYCQVALEF